MGLGVWGWWEIYIKLWKFLSGKVIVFSRGTAENAEEEKSEDIGVKKGKMMLARYLKLT